MKQEEFADRLRKQTGGISVSSRLRQKTLDAAYGKEAIRMKKRIPAFALAVVLSVVFCATALAIAGRAGMLDYVKLFSYANVPENASESIEQNVFKTANELVDISIRELYYDGHTSRLTVDITPKDESIFLVCGEPGASWKQMNWLNPEFDESDTRTVQEVYADGGYTAAYAVSVGIYDASNGSLGGSGGWFYTAPGVLTFFLQDSYAADLPEREVRLSVVLMPFLDADGNLAEQAADRCIRLEESLMLSSSACGEKVYVNTEPVTFGDIGVTLEQMQMFVKPQELYVKLHYTVSDTELNRRIYSANTRERERLRPEFIDPAVETDGPYMQQRLKEGMTGHVIRRMISGKDEMPMRFVEEFTLGLNEFSDSYTVRIFDYMSEVRYDSAEVLMREATAEEIAQIRKAE